MQKFLRRLIFSSFFVLCISATMVYAAGSGVHKATELRGPHGGQLLTEGNLAAEIIMYEKGTPPRFRVYVYQNDKPVAPSQVNLKLLLKRFNNDTNTIDFEPVDGFLQSREIIEEPHSFDVTVTLNYNNKTYSWNYPSYEGRITLSSEMIQASGIKMAIAAPTTIEKTLHVFGKIISNRDAMASIYPRYSGIIKTLNKNLGDSVQKGELIAVIESNRSLDTYSVVSPINGTIVKKLAAIGEMAKEDEPLYEIANLSDVWADLTLYRKEAPYVKKGMKVVVTGDEGKPHSNSLINYISPLGIEDSQTVLDRAVLPNQNQEWLPGMYVNATITIAEKSVPIAVAISAVQRLRDEDVVFIQQGNTFEATPVTLGEKNGNKVEIVSGLKAGQSYVAKNSFFLKADLGKVESSHDH